MSYGHAEKIVRSAAAVPPAPPVDPRLFDSPEMRRILADRDVGGLFRAVKATGVSYRTIAALVGMSQSEVSEIIGGRQVLSYDLLVRIAQGLGVPRERMGLSYGAYAGDEAPQSGEVQEVTEDVQRRDAIAVGALATLGFVPSFAALLDSSAAPGEVPLPSRLGASDVTEIRNTTESLRASARLSGGQARTASAAAAHCRRLTAVPAAEQVTRSLGSALAELDELAGWCCHDAGLDRHAR